MAADSDTGVEMTLKHKTLRVEGFKIWSYVFVIRTKFRE